MKEKADRARGRTFVEKYGEERAANIKDRISKSSIGKHLGKKPEWVRERMRKPHVMGKEWRRKRSEYMKRINPMDDEVSRNRVREAKKKLYKEHPEMHLNHILKQKGHITIIEKLMKEELERREIDFIYQHRIEGFWVDFYIPIYNMVIECDGNYWHKYPLGTEKDRIKTNQLENSGYLVVRFWETEIMNDVQKCVDKVAEMMREMEKEIIR